MRKSVSRLLAVGLLLAACGIGGLYARIDSNAGTHLQHADCTSCHVGDKDVAPQQAGVLVASQEVLCGKCHQAAIRVSHPSGLRPARVPPPEYPLDWKGDMTCSTCHQVHASGKGLMRGDKSGKALCLTCHEATFFAKMRDGGVSLMAGHLAVGVAAGAPMLDPYSRMCMDCHGESASPRLATGIDRHGVVRHASQSANHPIGGTYQKASAYGGYRPLRMVERKLLLPGGKVGCVSCHGGYQKEHGKLAAGLTAASLCMECHDL